MAVNPDPKPGRWILPLVILGMIAFTYFFVRELPEASTQTTLVSAPGTGDSTTVPGNGGTGGGDGTTATSSPGTTPVDPQVQAYLDEIDDINTQLQAQNNEITTVNNGFNNDREIDFGETEDRFEAVEETTQGLAERQSNLTPPAGLEANQQSLQTAIDLASDSVSEALAGLRSEDTGEQRNAAVEAYTTAASNYNTEATNTHNAAGSSGGGG